jgi:hypothetical protein
MRGFVPRRAPVAGVRRQPHTIQARRASERLIRRTAPWALRRRDLALVEAIVLTIAAAHSFFASSESFVSASFSSGTFNVAQRAPAKSGGA